MSSFSDWRQDLIEIADDLPTTDKKASKKVKEKSVNNKVIINPGFKESVENMGGEILEMKEVDDEEVETNKEVKQKAKDEKAKKEVKAKQQRVGLAKKMILQKKMQAVRAGAGADITASYEPVGPVLEGVMKMIKRIGKKKTDKKPEKAMDAGARARRRLQQRDHETVNFLPMKEAKLEKGYSDYGKASVRNKRKFGTSGEMPDIMTGKKITKDATRGELIDKRRAEHKAKRGVKEEVVTERLGGKGYKAYTSMSGKKVSGDWEDSDRGAGNKAKKRAGGKVEKKSPTYQAYVMNKEDKAFEFVKNKLKAKYGDGVMTTGEKMKPQSAAEKAKVRAHQAKIDKENAAARAKDPSQGRYSRGY